MPVEIKRVLVCDAVDESCIELLKKNGIHVIKNSTLLKSKKVPIFHSHCLKHFFIESNRPFFIYTYRKIPTMEKCK